MARPPEEEFVRRLLPLQERLVVFARHLVDDPAEAEDVLQGALETAYRQRERFEPDTSFRAWISRYLVHEAANANRRNKQYDEAAEFLGWSSRPSHDSIHPCSEPIQPNSRRRTRFPTRRFG